jgi:hypothetical protein
MFTVRMWLPKKHGRADLHLVNPNISPNSVVHISMSEATDLTGEGTFPGGQNFSVFLGSAAITVQNVVVGSGRVDFRAFIDWPSPLNVVADITILDGPPNVLIGT